MEAQVSLYTVSKDFGLKPCSNLTLSSRRDCKYNGIAMFEVGEQLTIHVVIIEFNMLIPQYQLGMGLARMFLPPD